MAKDSDYTRGVAGRKGNIGALFTSVDQPAYPYAFVNVYIDPETGLAEVQKTDGVGSKSVTRLIYALETDDFSVFGGDADDVFAMNAGDVACAGVFGRWKFTDDLSINQLIVDKQKYIDAFNARMAELKELYAKHDLPFIYTGGETADLIHQCDSVILGGFLTARTKPKQVITGEDVAPGDVIIGIRSGGTCNLETKPNSGAMSNGATGTRVDLVHSDYAKKYPFIACELGDPYTGTHKLDDEPADLGMTLGEALMSPTRQYAIMMKALVDQFGIGRDGIHGFVHCTGGGPTKCTVLGQKLHYIKDEMPKPDPIFTFYQGETQKPWKKMVTSYNLGIGADVMVNESLGPRVVEFLSNKFEVGSQPIGKVIASKDNINHVTIDADYGNFTFDQE